MAEPINVLLIVMDGVRADHLSCYGYERETTPFLDELARDGVRFSNMIATAPSTLASHAALFTGLHSVTHGATSEQPILAKRHPVLGEALKAAGYRTAAFCTNPWISPETGFGRAFDAFVTQRYDSRLATRAVSFGRRTADRLLRRADSGARRTNLGLARWLSSSQRPFFAYVHYNETHFPVQPPPQFMRRFLSKRIDNEHAEQVNTKSTQWMLPPATISDEDRTILRDLYDGTLAYIDQRVSEVASLLRANGLWDRTLIVLTADHGEYLGERGLVGHAVGLGEGLLRVPLLLRCPAVIPPGFVIDELAQSTDVAPTICTLLGLSAATFAHGRALIAAGRATPGPGFAIAERFRSDSLASEQFSAQVERASYDVRIKAIRTRREKFVWRSDEQNEFYDLSADPGESENLIERDTVRADLLRRQLFDWLADTDSFEGPEDEAAATAAGAI
ncbi:MAG TPA: sulfatase [Candidatus Acidoferrales bacterium]|nr:sulfatase [Candidatus Acidoferrales bacterium]